MEMDLMTFWKVAPLIAMAILPFIQAAMFLYTGSPPHALLMVGIGIANGSLAWVGMDL